MNPTLENLIAAGAVLKCVSCDELNAWAASDSNMRDGERIEGSADADVWEEKVYLLHPVNKLCWRCGNCTELNLKPNRKHIIAALNADKGLLTAVTSGGYMFTHGVAKKLVIAERHGCCLAFVENDLETNDKIIGEISL